MNPLSHHPPRTPRTSVTSSIHAYGGDIYTPKEELIEHREDLNEDDEDIAVHEKAKSKVRTQAVWREILKTSYGRDKAFVSISHDSEEGCSNRYLENYTILSTLVSPHTYLAGEIKHVQANQTAVLGTRASQTA